MVNKKYKAFTLMEILIVMGILIILITVGVAVGRYAIKRANRIQHQSSADQLFMALVKYKNINGKYPELGICNNCIEEQFFAEALGYKGTNSLLSEYLETGTFNGGLDTTYYYYVDTVDAQFSIVCVALGGIDDELEYGYYCTGDGLGFLPPNQPLNSKSVGSAISDPFDVNIIRGFDASDWYKDVGFGSN